MKLWCVNYHDADENTSLSWHVSKREAELALAQWNLFFKNDSGDCEIIQVNIPTSTRAQLASWLNTYCNKDNA